MVNTHSPALLYQSPVQGTCSHSPVLSSGHHNQESGKTEQANKRSGNKGILQTLVLHPGRNTITNCKTHDVSNYDNGSNSLARNLMVAVYNISNSIDTAKDTQASSDSKADNDSKPVDAMIGAHTP